MEILTSKPKAGQLVAVYVRPPIKTWWAKFSGYQNPVEYYVGEVVDLNWLPADQFAITTGDPKFPVRVIVADDSLEKVQIDGQHVRLKIETGKYDYDIVIKSAKSNEQYNVKIRGGKPISCTCKGFGFRRTCKHLNQAAQIA